MYEQVTAVKFFSLRRASQFRLTDNLLGRLLLPKLVVVNAGLPEAGILEPNGFYKCASVELILS